MKPTEKPRDDGVEIESQLILRLPEEPAKLMREAVREGANNLKDRLTVKLESDMRFGEVRFDHWLLHAKIMDLPTIIESQKTIDNKSFYKTADICQLLICKEEPDLPVTDEESPNKNKKKDPNKVDKKYLWPHGITPPCKNIRKRRFRKTLKKKFVEAPEIEKEVKRLLRADNEAVKCSWDLVTDDQDDKNIQSLQNELGMPDSSLLGEDGGSRGMGGGGGDDDGDSGGRNDNNGNNQLSDKHKKNRNKDKNGSQSTHMPRDIDIFGEDLSSSDEDDHHNINVELDETSRLSADDSRMSDYSMQGTSGGGRNNTNNLDSSMDVSSRRSGANFYEIDRHESDENDYAGVQMSQESINIRMAELKRQLNELSQQRIQKEQEISSIQNLALRQRLQESLDNILGQILDHQMELQDLQQATNE